MNAYELYEAAFDTACDFTEETVDYLRSYAGGAFDLYVPEEVCQKILDCRAACREATEQNGEGANNSFYLIKRPLEAIEI